jgi:methionyl-tRNA formyltransferase
MTRVGFAGTNEWSAETLRLLHARDDVDVAVVLTQPDRPAGRGRRTVAPPVAQTGAQLGLPVLQPERPAHALDELRAAGCEAMVVVAYGELVPRALLAAFTWLNVHPSLLPRWRGAAPIERAIMAGDRELAVAVMVLVQALDAGPVAALERFTLADDENAGVAYARALELAIDPLADALRGAARGSLATVPQVGEPTYAAKLTADDRLLDPGRPARELHDRVRALAPHIGARLPLGGAPFVVWRTRVEPALEAGRGSLVVVDGRLLLGTGDGTLELLELQAPGKRALAADAWLRGVRALPQPDRTP